MFKLKKKKNENKTKIIGSENNESNLINKMLFNKIQESGIPEKYVQIERYSILPPFAYAIIAQHKENLDYLYITDELPFSQKEKQYSTILKEILEYELQPAKENEDPRESFNKQLPNIISNHKDDLSGITSLETRKIIYYVTRDILGFERIGSIMNDPFIEDISCGGLDKSIYVWHKKYESLATDIQFNTEDELDNFVAKLVHLAGKHISTTFPIVDATLPGKHRLSALFRREVTPLGTSFTIRKFREDPYTIIDLLNMGTIDETIAAYLWMLMDHKMSLMVLGSTGAGKTTTLNAFSGFIPSSYKIFTVEEVSEINLPHENWVSSISRTGYGSQDEGAIGLYELLKSAVRHRPDYIVVGEVRGDEAYVLFQAVATGHGGLCTMHADAVETSLKRLVQEPMNVPAASISLMNCALVIKRVEIPTTSNKKKITRRVIQVAEIIGQDTVKNLLNWKPINDEFDIDISSSRLLKRISESSGKSMEETLEEIERRKRILRWMRANNIRNYRNFSQIIEMYRKDPERIYLKALKFTDVSGN